MGQRLKTETVKLISKVKIGEDPFGAPVYEETEVDVSGVLVGFPEAQDVTDELNLTGKRIAYALGIPKGDTNTWYDTFVIIRGERFRTIGRPVYGTPGNMPMWWSGKVMVEHYGGED